MLTVIKRSGKQEPFSEEKVARSLANTSDEAGQAFTRGDVSSMVQELVRMLQEKTTVSSREVYVMIVGILFTRGFAAVAARYTGSQDNAWRI